MASPGKPSDTGGSSDRTAQLLGAAAATTWLVVFVLVDLVTAGASIVLAPLFALSPVIACAVLSARRTAVFAIAAVACTVAAGWWNDVWATGQHYVRTIDVVLVSGAAVVVAAVRVRREQRFARVVVIAEVAQRAILPTLPRQIGTVTLGARYLSAAEDAVVGGDLYDCYHADGHLRVLVGDVRGKGIAAVEQAARVIRAFRQSAATDLGLAEVAEDMDAYLKPFFDIEEFVTALLVEVAGPGRFRLVSCGHPPPLLVRSTGEASFVEANYGRPLGLGDDYEETTGHWQPGDRILMYTDGLSEARDKQGEFLPLLDLGPVLATGAVEESLDGLLAAVRRHVPGGDLPDDLAVVLLQYTEPATTGWADDRATGGAVPAT